MRHIIGKQLLDLTVEKGLDVFDLQQRVSDRFYQDILPELEKQLDAVSGPDQTIRIGALEVDLGVVTEAMIDSGDWAETFREALQQQLERYLSEIADRTGGSIEPIFETAFRNWFYFVRHGHLRWNAPRPSAHWLEQVLEAIARNYQRAGQIREILLKEPVAAKRIALHHPEDFLAHLVELLTAEKQESLPAAIWQLTADLASGIPGLPPFPGTGQKEIAGKLWTAVVQKCAVNEPNQDTKELTRYLLQDWLRLSREAISGLENGMETMGKGAMKGDTSQEPERQIPARFTENVAAGIPAHAGLSLAELEEGIFINHAGLVLLHPFLSTFFRKLGLVQNGTFPDLKSQEHAICLLHELVEPGTPPMEYDLVLAKLLCNWPLEKPVNTALEISPEERAEADNLLEAAIGQWEVLKSTSPAAFREIFLQREGKLFCRDGKWYLQVEKKSFDILLSRLPWVIGMVKLPWMKDLLRVEWG